MEPKKNPKKDLNRKSGLFFTIGMLLVLLLAFVALEWKTYVPESRIDVGMNPPDDIDDAIPPITLPNTPPPPPPAAAAIIEIAPDKKDIEETIIETTEPEEEKTYEYKDIDVAEEEEIVEMAFSVIEDVPVFPGCENADDKRVCFQKMMNKHIAKNFRYPEPAQEMGIQGRVNIMFVIQKDGSIGNVQMRGPDKNLESEARRIIDKLPKMVPGKQRGQAVRVPFSIPITFKLQ